MSVAGGHIAFGFNNAGGQQRFLFIGKHTVAAVLHSLTTPPWAHFMQYAFVLFAHRKSGAGAVGQVVDLFFNPADGIFRENGRGAHFACLVTDNQFVMFNPDGAFRQMVGQRQRAAYRNRFIQMLLVRFGIVACAFGADRRLNNMYQRGFVSFDAVGQFVESQSGHGFYPRSVAVNPFSRAYCWAKSSSAGSFSGLSGAK